MINHSAVEGNVRKQLTKITEGGRQIDYGTPALKFLTFMNANETLYNWIPNHIHRCHTYK